MALLAAMTAGAAESSSLDVSITGMRSLKGNVLICLTANPMAFPDCSKDAHSHKLVVAAAKAGSVHFAELAPGLYAISLIHDENANGKLDTAMMIPREGFGFSMNPAIVFGPPKFASARFGIGPGENLQGVKVKYML